MTSVDDQAPNVGDLIQNVVDTIDTAHKQRASLTELLGSIEEAKKQVTHSASISKTKVKNHFESIQKRLSDILTGRLSEFLTEIDELERHNLEPLTQCEEMINVAITDAAQCMEHGKTVLGNAPEDHMDMLLKFKDSSDTKNLNILPEVPSLYEVANIDINFHDNLCETVRGLVMEDGCVYERAPVQVTELHEVPGGMLVSWEEIDDSVEAGEFRLQYCHGKALSWDLSNIAFHTVYTGPNVSFLVTKLRTNMPYSFRVSCRQDQDSQWSVWSVPRTALTRMSHYQWQSETAGYSSSNEDKVGTRTTGLTRVLYSKTPCYKSGYRITFRILDTGEKSPMDGLGISVTSEDIETMKREGAAFLGTDGTMYVDGQEMKTKLPNLTRNSIVTIETETLPNGKVRVSVQVEEKELTFDWKIDRQVTLGLIGGTGMASFDNSGQCFYFGMIFSHEDWKVLVE